MHWRELTSTGQLDRVIQESFTQPVAIFKHSTRCSISSMAKGRLEREWTFTEDKLPIYYLDLIKFRDVSNKIEESIGVHHESPQLILIKDGKSIFDASHNAVSAKELIKLVA
jgi:bacillithiol system protein YtxJ